MPQPLRAPPPSGVFYPPGLFGRLALQASGGPLAHIAQPMQVHADSLDPRAMAGDVCQVVGQQPRHPHRAVCGSPRGDPHPRPGAARSSGCRGPLGRSRCRPGRTRRRAPWQGQRAVWSRWSWLDLRGVLARDRVVQTLGGGRGLVGARGVRLHGVTWVAPLAVWLSSMDDCGVIFSGKLSLKITAGCPRSQAANCSAERSSRISMGRWLSPSTRTVP